MNNTTKLLGLLMLLVSFQTFSCKEDLQPVDRPSDFTKEKREELGDMIQVAIAQHPDVFPVIPNIPPYDTSVYWFTQTLYNQATNALHLDNQAPAQDKWDIDRPWRVTILDMEEKNAFAIPGGHFYITSGLLNALATEHELYYILTFEAMLMNDRVLLNRLISEHNTTKLSNVGRRIPNSDGTNAFTLAQTLKALYFDTEEVLENDEHTAHQICNSSIFNRTGIIPVMERLESDTTFTWLNTRYYDPASRSDYIQIVLSPNNCGEVTQNGGYQRYILNILN